MKMSFHLIFIVIGNSGNLEIFIERVTHILLHIIL